MKNCPYSEEELLEIAQRFKKHLKQLVLIQGENPDLGQDFIYRFKARFYEAQAHAHPHPLDSEANRITSGLNRDLDLLISHIREAFKLFRYSIQKACPYDLEVWDACRYTNLERSSVDSSVFRKHLEEFLKLTNEKKTELLAAHCPTHDLDEIKKLSVQFYDKHDQLLEYIERKEIRNKVYKLHLAELFKLMEMVHNAASKNLQKDPEILKHLIFPPKE